MIRLIFILVTVCLFLPKIYGQITVYQDKKGQILTTLDSYASGNRSLTPTHNRVTYMGSPFLTFPVWQAGTIQLDTKGQEIAGELAYNLATNEVMCRLMGDSTVRLITPEVFTINGKEFLREHHKLPGLTYQSYFTRLHGGQTKLLTRLSSRVEEMYNNAYNRDIQGIYRTQNQYYIQKGNAQPEFISLTKNSVLTNLYEQAEKIAARLPAKPLTPDDLTKALIYYDSLMAAERANKLPLLADPTFTQTLHEKIIYPNYARTQGVYGRVYAGFDIDERGRIKNIAILSPDNSGFPFDAVVRNALEKLPPVGPVCQGKYALPIAFTFTNSKETTGPHVPLNRLTEERLQDRILLDEYVVPAIVSKPVTTSREVWGYYK